MKSVLAVVAFALFAQPALADPLPTPMPAMTPPVTPAATTAALCCHVASGFPVVVELTNEVSSRTVKPGDTFALVLALPLIADGKVLAPAGATGGGEVVDSAHAGLMGNPGKLVLAARYIDYGGVRIPLRAFKLGGGGANNLGVAFGVALVVSPVLSAIIPGSDIVYAPGTRAVAKVAADLTLSPMADQTALPATPAAPATPAPVTTTQPPPSTPAQRPSS